MNKGDSAAQVAIVGAGPIGLEMAVTLKKAGVDYLHFEQGQIGHTITWFPPMMRFYSSAERIAIAGVPIPRVDQSKATREEYLAYLRGIVEQFDLDVRTYEPVKAVEKLSGGGFFLHTSHCGDDRRYEVERVVFAIGDMHMPNRLGIPGEDLPHVDHYFKDPHQYFRQKLLVVGGKNSAVEAALRCYGCGTDVAISYRRPEFDPAHIKYWLLPEMQGRIRRGEIRALFETAPVEIRPGSVVLRNTGNGSTFEVEADWVLLLIGYRADLSLMTRAGIELIDIEEKPRFNEATMETNVPGLYVAGTTTAGSQQSYRVFIENCHIHSRRILAHIQGAPPPDAPGERTAARDMPES